MKTKEVVRRQVVDNPIKQLLLDLVRAQETHLAVIKHTAIVTSQGFKADELCHWRMLHERLAKDAVEEVENNINTLEDLIEDPQVVGPSQVTQDWLACHILAPARTKMEDKCSKEFFDFIEKLQPELEELGLSVC